jgi:hypothetical protein
MGSAQDRFLPLHFNASQLGTKDELKQDFLQRMNSPPARAVACRCWEWSAAWPRRRASTW